MADPAVTARTTPGGIMLEDGFSTKIAFSLDPDISLWEKTVTPPGYDGGEPIDITTMHNTAFKTKAARQLIDVTGGEFTAGYDPAVYTQIQAIINKPGAITWHFPDGSTVSAFGYLQKFDVQSHEEGKMCEANCTIVVTNYDHTNHVEVAPLVNEVAGT